MLRFFKHAVRYGDSNLHVPRMNEYDHRIKRVPAPVATVSPALVNPGAVEIVGNGAILDSVGLLDNFR